MKKYAILFLLCLLVGCNKPQNRMQAHARTTGLQALHQFPVYLALRFSSTSEAHDHLYAWFKSHGFRYVSSAFDPAGRKVSDAFAYRDLVESSIAEIGPQTWVMVYGVLADDQTLRSHLQELVREVTSTHTMELEDVTLP